MALGLLLRCVVLIIVCYRVLRAFTVSTLSIIYYFIQKLLERLFSYISKEVGSLRKSVISVIFYFILLNVRCINAFKREGKRNFSVIGSNNIM